MQFTLTEYVSALSRIENLMRYHRHSISTDATAETKSYEQSNLFPPHTPFKQLINRWNSHLKLNGHSQLKVLYQIHQNKSIAYIPFLCMVFVKVISQSKFHRGSCGGSLFVNSPFYLSLVYVFSAPNPWRPTPILLNSIRFSITLLHQNKGKGAASALFSCLNIPSFNSKIEPIVAAI